MKEVILMDVSLVKNQNVDIDVSGRGDTKNEVIKVLLDIMKSGAKELFPLIKKKVFEKYDGAVVITSAQEMLSDLDKYQKEHELTFDQRILVEERKAELLKIIAKEYRFKHATEVLALVVAMGTLGLMAYVTKGMLDD